MAFSEFQRISFLGRILHVLVHRQESGALPRVDRIRWVGGFAGHDHDLELVQVERPFSPIACGSAPHMEHRQAREAEKQAELGRHESPLTNRQRR